MTRNNISALKGRLTFQTLKPGFKDPISFSIVRTEIEKHQWADMVQVELSVAFCTTMGYHT
jgi:hypothetical protein